HAFGIAVVRTELQSMAEAMQQFNRSAVVGAVAHRRFNRECSACESLRGKSPCLESLELCQCRSRRRYIRRNIARAEVCRQWYSAQLERRDRVQLYVSRKFERSSPEVTHFDARVPENLMLHAERPREHFRCRRVRHQVCCLRSRCSLCRRRNERDGLHGTIGKEAGAGWG